MVEVTVAHLGVEEETNTPVVLLQEKAGDRVIRIYIGHAEANAIAMELADVKFERPLTHDLLQQVIVGLGAVLKHVVVTRVERNTYYAELQLQRADHVVQIDARPSDSIAIALRLNAPIFTSEELLAGHAGEQIVTHDSSTGDSAAEKLKNYLQKLNPEDFGKFTP